MKYSILWGLACVIVVDLIHPMIANLVRITPDLAKYIICGVLCTVFVVDAIFTVIQLITYKKNYAALEKISDALKKPSNAIGGKIAASTLAMNDKMLELNEKIKSSRLYKAFPEQLRKTKPSKDTVAINSDAIEEIATVDNEVKQ